MRHRGLFLLLVLLAAPADGQWLKFVPPGTPLTRDGTPNLTAPAPRAADGRPDLSGVWMHEATSVADHRRLFGPVVDVLARLDVPGMELASVHKYAVNILADFKPDEVSLRPEGEELRRRRLGELDPADVCSEVPGFPLAGLLSDPIKIVQAPTMTVILYELGSLHRQIYSDGRSFPKEFEFPAFLGYSVGRWERDVFIVDTTGFNDRTRLDVMWHPHSDALRITERFRRIDYGHMNVDITIDDPRMYTKPFTITVPHTLLPDGDIFETFCENEKDRVHLQNANPRR